MSELQKNDLKKWDCVVEAGKLTVGSVFQLKCKGEEQKLSDKLSFITNSNNKYELQVLKVNALSEVGADITVTSYKPGDYNLQNVILTDGTSSVMVNSLSWKVESVIEPESQPTPFGPLGPYNMYFPIWFWLVLLGIISGIGYFIWNRLNKWNRRRKLIRSLVDFDTALSPVNQFYKEQRQLARKAFEAGAVSELDNYFRLFLVRELRLPVLNISEKELDREIRNCRFNKKNSDLYKDIRKVIDEIRRAKELSTEQDLKQLTDLVRQIIETIAERNQK